MRDDLLITLLTTLGRTAWQGALVIGFVFLLCRLLSRHLTANVRCWLWRLVYVRFLLGLILVGGLALPMLPSISSLSFDTGNSIHTTDTVTSQTSLPARPAEPGPLTIRDGTIFALNFLFGRSDKTQLGTPAKASEKQTGIVVALAALYALGVSFCLARLLIAANRTRHLLRSATLITDSTTAHDSPGRAALNALATLSQQFGLRRAPHLARCSLIQTPLYAAGTILLPETMDLPADDLRLVLAHELAHARRYDLVYEWLGTVTQILFFFHPLVVLARREERLARESAADALVLQIVHAAAARYGRLLVDLSLVLSPSSPAPLAGAVGAVEGGSMLQRRLLALREVATAAKTRKRLPAFVGLIAALAAVVALVPWRMVAAADETRMEPPTEQEATPGVSDRDAKAALALLKRAFARYQDPNLRSFSATIRHHNSSGLYPGDYDQELKWRRGEAVNGKDSRFTLLVTSPNNRRVHDFYCDGTRLITDGPDLADFDKPDNGGPIRRARFVGKPDVEPHTSPGWEVSGGAIVSVLMRTSNGKIFRGEFPEALPDGSRLSLALGPRRSWQGQQVREVLLIGVGPTYPKMKPVSLFVGAQGDRFVGYEAWGGRRDKPTLGYMIYIDQKFNPEPAPPATLGTPPPTTGKVVDLWKLLEQ